GVSWRVLREDLEAAYELAAAPASAGVTSSDTLPPRTTPFSWWATRLAEPAVREGTRDELAYWERVASAASTRLPRDLAGADVSRTVGWFTTIFPVRLPLGAADVGARLRATKELLRAIPRRGLGYGVLRYLDGAETLRAQTTPDVVFNYLGQFDQMLAGSRLF